MAGSPPPRSPGGRHIWCALGNPGRKESVPGLRSGEVPLFQVKVDRSNALVEVSLEGSVRPEEMHQFVAQAVGAIRELAQEGRPVKALADLRQFRATSPEATEILQHGQAAAMQATCSLPAA